MLLDFFKILFYMYEAFTYMYISIPHVCLVSEDDRRWHRIPQEL